MLKIAVDYSETAHHEQLVKNALLQHCLSVINHLGFHGDFRPRSHGGKFAMLALSIKGAFLVITVASNSPIGTREKLIPLDDPDVVDAVTGCTAWGISLLAWLSDSLFQLLDDPEVTAMLSGPKRFPELAKYLESKNDVALQLLLCSSTRGFLLALCRRLQHIENVSNRTAHYYETRFQQQDPAAGGGTGAAAPARPHPALSRAYQRMERVISSALVKVSEFERLLSDLGTDIQTAYHKSFSGIAAKVKPQPANLTEQQQQQHNEQFIKKAQTHCELDMLLGQNLPPSFREVLLKLFTATLPAFRAQTDPAKLYFADYSLLEMDDSPMALAARKAARRYVDVFKRTELVVAAGRSRGSRGPTRQAGGAPGGGGGGGAPPFAGSGSGSSSSGGGMPTTTAAVVWGDNGMASYRTAIFGTWTGMGSGGDGPQWRRCVRCAAVVGDLFTGKPGYHFVLSQQRKCVCGGSWGTVPRGT
jgi:mediator of RNA polymerase II transcription subunit 16